MKFDKVLEELKIKNNSSDPITHTLINGGKLHVPQKHLPGFYKKLISACIDKNENHQIVEHRASLCQCPSIVYFVLHSILYRHMQVPGHSVNHCE